jgi:hypothetical protein
MSICNRLADGESLRAICSDAGMPSRATIFRWIARHNGYQLGPYLSVSLTGSPKFGTKEEEYPAKLKIDFEALQQMVEALTDELRRQAEERERSATTAPTAG